MTVTVIDEIHVCPQRTDVQIRLPDDRTFAGPVGTTLDAFLQAINHNGTSAMAALVNGHLVELSERMLSDADVTPLTLKDEVGRRVYQTSLILLLIAATEDCFPGARIAVDHSLTFGGFFCRVLNRAAFSEDDLAKIEVRMRQMVADDAPIGREDLPLDRAIELFRAMGDEAEIRLLNGQPPSSVTLRTLGKVRESFYSPLVPSARYLKTFEL
jgi:uridine kinase